MKKKITGIILIFLSFILMITGFIIDVVIDNQVVIPNKNNIVNDSDKHITVTSNDEENLLVNKDGNVVDQDGNKLNNNIEQNNTNSDNTLTDSIDITNDNLRNNLEKKYGIEILYGSETAGYSIAGLSTTMITDSNVVTNELNILVNLMSLYPDDFFNELDDSIPLTIILVNNYSTKGVCGLTDSSYSRAVMSLASGKEFVDTFHHEIYHYMERYIYKNEGSFSNWVTLNPVGFEYGNVNDSFPTYNKTLSSYVYFVNSYSKTDEYEDRASIFEYLMASSKASCFNKDMPIYKKALAMSNMIDRYVNACSTTKTEYWERYLVG